jgi:hypothetical protein
VREESERKLMGQQPCRSQERPRNRELDPVALEFLQIMVRTGAIRPRNEAVARRILAALPDDPIDEA